MKIVCITKTNGLTVGKEYEIIRKECNPVHKWKNDGYVVINDDNIERWYEECPMGIIEVLEMTGEYVKYIGQKSSDLTFGKIYPLLNKYSNEYYYLMNDKNEFVGTSIINYFGGAQNFINITRERNNTIDYILNENT